MKTPCGCLCACMGPCSCEVDGVCCLLPGCAALYMHYGLACSSCLFVLCSEPQWPMGYRLVEHFEQNRGDGARYQAALREWTPSWAASESRCVRKAVHSPHPHTLLVECPICWQDCWVIGCCNPPTCSLQGCWYPVPQRIYSRGFSRGVKSASRRTRVRTI